MKTIEATYRIVTPMFIGGANQDSSDGIRPPSFKGVLRFWWRALNWGAFRSKNGATDDSALKALHKKEVELFGGAAKKEKKKQTGGQCLFRIIIHSHMEVAQINVANFSPRSYMLGQGLWGRGKMNRDALSGWFDVKIIYKDTVSNGDVESVTDAILFLGLLGGMGSKSRRGWGSICIERLVMDGDDIILPKDRESYLQRIKAFISRGEVNISSMPPFTTLINKSRICALVEEKDNPLDVIDLIGKQLGLYRGWGNKGKNFNQKAEQNFKPDHDDMLNVTKGKLALQSPKRLVFGLPHNYFFSSSKKKVDIKDALLKSEQLGRDVKFKRRGSPLMVHIHRLPDKTYIGLLLMMPAIFLPDNTQILIGEGRVSLDIDWNVIDDFLQRSAFMSLEKL